MIKWIVSLFVFLFSLAVIGVAGFFFTIFLIGPHSDILPDDVHIPVGLFLLTLIIGIPLLLWMKSFNYLKRKEQKIIQKKEFGN
ncbi:MAG: hypothetical protein IPM14_00380 [bacterium]|nr:hypothetical protein [bacterium]